MYNGQGVKDIYDFILNKGKKAHDFVKENKLISNLMKGYLTGTKKTEETDPSLHAIMKFFDKIGYGKKRRIRKRSSKKPGRKRRVGRPRKN